MLVDFFSSFIFGKHSAEMNTFEVSLKAGDTQGCFQMLERNPSLTYRTERDISGRDTPLQMAVRYGNHEVCDRLLSLGAPMDVIHEYDGERASPMMKVASAQYDAARNSEAVRAVFVKHYIERRRTSTRRGTRKTIGDACTAAANRLLAWVQEPVAPILTVQATIDYFEASVIVRQKRSPREPEDRQMEAVISGLNKLALQATARQELSKTAEPAQFTD